MKETVSIDAAKSTARATISRALASALITGFEEAAEEGRSLSDLQKMDMATLAIMEYHDAVVWFDSSIDVEVELAKSVKRGINGSKE